MELDAGSCVASGFVLSFRWRNRKGARESRTRRALKQVQTDRYARR
jgi:hypothetical protein